MLRQFFDLREVLRVIEMPRGEPADENRFPLRHR
jgi:hypothetical protein